MIYAAGEGHTAIVRLLLGKGVDPNQAYDNGLTALMWAAGYGRDETVRALLEAGARADVRDNRGKTAADIARERQLPGNGQTARGGEPQLAAVACGGSRRAPARYGAAGRRRRRGHA